MGSSRAHPPAGVDVGLMLALTFTTGVVDAAGYLGLDQVFSANMTGNVVILGLGLADARGLPVLGPVMALAGFCVGAAVAGVVLRRAEVAWTARTTALLGVVAAMVLALAGVGVVVGEHPARPVALAVTAALSAAMGVQAATARFVAVTDVPTVVITSTLTGLVASSVFGREDAGGPGRRVAAVALLVAGAVCGALLLRYRLAAALLLAGSVVLAVALLGEWYRRRGAQGAAP